MDIVALIEQSFAHYGYAIVFLGAFFESLLLFGFFLPGSFIVLFGGYFAKMGHSSLSFTIFLAFLGMFLGDMVNYMLGRAGLGKFLEKKKFLSKVIGKHTVVSEQLHKYGTIAIFYSHILGYTRSVICFSAGAVKYPFKTFLLSTFIASSLWGIVFVGLGYFLGTTTEGLKNISVRVTVIAWLGILAFVIMKLVQNFVSRRFFHKK